MTGFPQYEASIPIVEPKTIILSAASRTEYELISDSAGITVRFLYCKLYKS